VRLGRGGGNEAVAHARTRSYGAALCCQRHGSTYPAPSGQNRAMEDPPAGTRTFGRSVLAVVQGNLTQVAADAIVNAANSAFANGSRVSSTREDKRS
jgi:hypothetical protein